MRKLNKKAGVVGDLISGTGGLIILTVIVFIIVSTLLAANIISDLTSGKTVTSESGAWLNTTPYTVSTSTAEGFTGLAITGADNYTGGTPTSIALDNFTISGSTFTNASTATYSNLTINYTYTSTDQNLTKSATFMSGNMTSGVDNVSSKIPTILLIAAVVLLFGVIVLLVRQAGAMGIGQGGASL